MRIGIEVQMDRILAAASEDEHFTILDEKIFPDTASISQRAEWITHFYEPPTNDPFWISIPSYWNMTDRKIFSDALHANGIRRYTFVPDCIAALATAKSLYSIAENLDLIYLTPYSERSKKDSKVAFSFLSCFSTCDSPLWEGSFVGDEKFLRKMANHLGYLHKNEWSDSLTLCGDEKLIQRIFAPSKKNFPVFCLDKKAVLQGMTLYKDTLCQLMTHLHFRCHSRFYMLEAKTYPDTKTPPVQMLPFSGAVIPLPWNDYHCCYFWTDEDFARVAVQNTTWNLYEKPFYDENRFPRRKDPDPLLSFSLTKPSGLWVEACSGMMDWLPFIENTPQTIISADSALISETTAREKICEILKDLQKDDFF